MTAPTAAWRGRLSVRPPASRTGSNGGHRESFVWQSAEPHCPRGLDESSRPHSTALRFGLLWFESCFSPTHSPGLGCPVIANSSPTRSSKSEQNTDAVKPVGFDID